MKNIHLEFPGKAHSLYNLLLSNPPQGYRFNAHNRTSENIARSLTRIDFLYSFQDVVLNKLLPITILKAKIEGLKKTPKDCDLTYSAGHLIFRDEPWVVDLEFITQLAGYKQSHLRRYRSIIEKCLGSKQCKKIICWTEAGKKSITYNINNKEIINKIELVTLSTTQKKFTKETKNGVMKILFVGSSNIPGEFEFKGGIDVLRLIKILNKKYDNLEFVIRSDIPPELISECKKIDNLRIIDRLIPWKHLEYEFKTSDIFLFPSHSTPGLVLLDAMSYELPIITSNVWANAEMVNDGHNGFLIPPNRYVTYTNDRFVPVWTYRKYSKFMRSTHIFDKERMKQLVDSTSILIEDEKIRQEMGKKGRKMIETGKYSMEKRNTVLKRVLDEATG